jgi:hypothetical protein
MTQRILRVVALCGSTITAVLFATAAAAQSLPSRDDPSCLRFRFGPWSPALDWNRAGHPGTVDSFRIARAEGGQAWAAAVPPTTRTAPGDTVLVLYPAFWPVGVMVQFDPAAFAGRDTLAAHATAFVADGNTRSPTSTVTLWKVPCR